MRCRGGCDLIIAADEVAIEAAAEALRRTGASVEALQADLGTEHGLDQLWREIEHRGVDYLLANAGRG